jgi:cytochrome oxidase Cu insertion factor (SCO1/SenC/PrrC family)
MEDRLTGTGRGGGGATALAILAVILGITAGWWTLALWPLPAAAPDWLVRTRAACFGARPDGLPDAGGWVLLIGEPLGLIAILSIVWGTAVRAGLATLARSGIGRLTLGAASLALLVGITAAGARVRRAQDSEFQANQGALATDYPRLHRVAPPLRLLDQRGDSVALTQFRGRPVLVAFAYAHCQTVCPVVVHDVLEAQARARAPALAVLVVTLDPWRDTPQRLGYIAESWGMSGEAHVLSGAVETVERVLDDWGIPRERDRSTGEITHPTPIYLIDREGRIAYVATGGAGVIGELVRGL